MTISLANTKVLVVDDDPGYGSGFCRFLSLYAIGWPTSRSDHNKSNALRDFSEDLRLIDHADDFHLASAVFALMDIDPEDTFTNRRLRPPAFCSRILPTNPRLIAISGNVKGIGVSDYGDETHGWTS